MEQISREKMTAGHGRVNLAVHVLPHHDEEQDVQNLAP
jgi:hypothetical protein